jgi:hypothetical protein
MTIFEVFGDSNVARSWRAVASDQDRLKGSVLRTTSSLAMLKDSFRTVAQSTRHLIVSALCNPISRLPFEDVSQVEPAIVECLEGILDVVIQTINTNPALTVSLLPSYVFTVMPLKFQISNLILPSAVLTY